MSDRPTEAELFGTPQKTPDGHLGEASAGVERRSEENLFGTSGGETPDPVQPSEEDVFGGPSDKPQAPAAARRKSSANRRPR